MWSPKASSDYSEWKSQFDDVIDAHCQDSTSMVKGLSLFGSALARKFFALFSSDQSVTALTNAIRDKNVNLYLSEHPAYIIAWVLGSSVLIISILLALNLIRSWRKKWRKVGCCADRPRVPFHELKSSTYYGNMAAGLTLFVLLFALSIGTFVHVGYIMEGFNGVTCDMWQTLRSHYFGAQKVTVNENVVHDWKGSNAQREVMVKLRDAVESNQPGGDRCPVCKLVEKHYSGSGGLVETVSTSRDAVVQSSYIMAVLWNVMKEFTYGINERYTISPPSVNDVVNFEKVHLMYYDTLLSSLLSSYAHQLDRTTEDGIKLFRETIDKYLGSKSPLLQESYITADTSITSLGDVDYVMANAVQKWYHTYPTLALLTRFLVAVGALIGIFAFAVPIIGLTVGWLLHDQRKAQLTPSRRLTRLTGALYATTITLCGFAFCFATVYLTLSQIGSDTCGFVNTVVYKDGNWRILPDSLWKVTPSQRTDMATVLDTCVKDTGSGDIASSLGIRMLLEKLTQSVGNMQEDIVKTTDIRLDLDFKSEKTNSLSYITSRSPQLLLNLPFRIKFPNNTVEPTQSPTSSTNNDANGDHKTDGNNDEYPVPTSMTRYEIKEDLFALRPDGGDEIIPATCIPVFLLDLKKDTFSAIQNFPKICFRHTILLSSGASAGLNFLNQIAKEANETGRFPFRSFCVQYLTEDGVCGNGKDVFMIDGTFNSDWVRNPFANQHIQTLLKDLNTRPTDRYTFAHVLFTFLYYDRFFQQPLTYQGPNVSKTDSDVTKSLLLKLPKLFPNPVDWKKDIPLRKFINVLLDIPECAVTEEEEKEKGTRCTLRLVHKAFIAKGMETAKALEKGFTVANGAVMDFVHNVTLATAWGQIKAAKESLRHLNCQFLGTALYEGARADLCDVVFPNIASLGLVTLLVSLGTGLTSIVLWRGYLYLNNLQQYGDIRTMKSNVITAITSKNIATE